MAKIGKRLRQYFESQGIKQVEIANAIGVSPTYITKIYKDEREIGKEQADRWVDQFGLSRIWLLTGEGSMLNPLPIQQNSGGTNTQTNGNNNITTNTTNNYRGCGGADKQAAQDIPDLGDRITILEDKPQKSLTSGRPYYNVDFLGGFDLVLNDSTIVPDYNIDFAPLNKPGVMWCNITGNSMYPKLTSGAIIAIREVVSWKDFLTFGEIYAIVTTNDLRTVKIVRKAENENNFKLVPINTAEYDEQEIPKEMVARVFEVLGSINRF